MATPQTSRLPGGKAHPHFDFEAISQAVGRTRIRGISVARGHAIIWRNPVLGRAMSTSAKRTQLADAQLSAPEGGPKRVALILESMMAPRRTMMTGVARFVQSHEPWSIYLKPT